MTGDDSQSQNPTHALPDWPSAVIAGAWRTGVLGMRSLYRRGVRARCFDVNPSFPGMRSKYGRGDACPNPDVDANGWLDFMIRIAKENGDRPVLIASADQFVSAIARHADALRDHYRLTPGAELQGQLATKETQYQLAATHGMPMPKTQLVSSAGEVEAFARDAQFPCLVKPLHFREWQKLPPSHPLAYAKIAISNSPAALLQNWKLASIVNPTTILQEIIQGGDTDKRVYVSCYDHNGRRTGHALFRELRCDPVGFGPATVSEPVNDDEADRVCDAFLRGIEYSGICEIEVKRDVRDGKVKLIEANPRLSGGGDAAPYAGVDICWLHYLDLIGQPVAPVEPNGKDFRHVVLESDIAALLNYRRARLITWRDVARSYRPPLAFFDLDANDWRASAGTVYRAARSAVGNVVRSFRRRAG